MTMLYIALGTIFGFALSRSGAADYDFVQGMFLFERFQLYGILATGTLFAAPGLWLIRRRGRTLGGAPIQIERKPGHRSGSSRRSGTSTSENRMLRNGTRPGGATV